MSAVLRLAVLGLLAATACGGPADDGDDGPSRSVRVTLEDFDVRLEPAAVAEGTVTFDVVNVGPSLHEFLLLRTEQPEDALPTDAQGTVEEEGPDLEVVEDVEALQANQTVAVEVDLAAESYVVICNIPSHYGLGMYATLTVE